jgi:tryptophan-rich hypothetical protein
MKPLNKPSYNRINPAKLHLSKWTAVSPQNKEKHFLVIKLNEDEFGVVMSCTLEAVLTRKGYKCNWQDLKDRTRWLTGWR